MIYKVTVMSKYDWVGTLLAEIAHLLLKGE
jgi:hypothetical protein